LADIKANLESIQERIAVACRRAGRSPEEVTLIAVTKTVDPASIELAFEAGVRNFGENRVQEAGAKISRLSCLSPRPTWHLIGHLQSNKVKTALELFDFIQSIDSVELAEAINRRAPHKMPVLLEINAGEEATKSGFHFGDIPAAMAAISGLSNLEVRGFMTVAPLAEDPETVRPLFRKLRELKDSFHLEHLSMGMTDDFEVAIGEGATMVRLGRAIFGERK
jgi:PLP dependent protein